MCPATLNNRYISFKVKVPLGNNLFFFFLTATMLRIKIVALWGKWPLGTPIKKNENNGKSRQKQLEVIQKKSLNLCQLSPSTDHQGKVHIYP